MPASLTDHTSDTGSSPAPSPGAAPPESAPELVSKRQCGRCRQYFASEPELHPGEWLEWWLCPPCDRTLFPNRART